MYSCPMFDYKFDTPNFWGLLACASWAFVNIFFTKCVLSRFVLYKQLYMMSPISLGHYIAT